MPQQRAWPFSRRAQVWLAPTLIWATFSMGPVLTALRTRTARVRGAFVASPSWPRVLAPQQRTRPLFMRAQAWTRPTLIWATPVRAVPVVLLSTVTGLAEWSTTAPWPSWPWSPSPQQRTWALVRATQVSWDRAARPLAPSRGAADAVAGRAPTTAMTRRAAGRTRRSRDDIGRSFQRLFLRYERPDGREPPALTPRGSGSGHSPLSADEESARNGCQSSWTGTGSWRVVVVPSPTWPTLLCAPAADLAAGEAGTGVAAARPRPGRRRPAARCRSRCARARASAGRSPTWGWPIWP